MSNCENDLNDTDLLTIINKRLQDKALILPTLPDVALEANERLADDDIEIADIVKIIKKDPAIAASIIKYANSALVKGSEKVTSIERATIRIGLIRLRTVIMSSAVEQIFFAKDISFALQLATAWSESTNAAVCSGATIYYLHQKGLAKHIDHDTLFLAALVHNIGILPILTEADSLGKEISKQFHNRAFVKRLMENKGNELTRSILEEWGFDETLIKPAVCWMDESFNTDEVSITDIMRMGISNTDRVTDKQKSDFLKSAMKKSLIESKDWSKEEDFKEALLMYKDLF